MSWGAIYAKTWFGLIGSKTWLGYIPPEPLGEEELITKKNNHGISKNSSQENSISPTHIGEEGEVAHTNSGSATNREEKEHEPQQERREQQGTTSAEPK